MNDIILFLKGDLFDVVCGVYIGLLRVVCVLDVFEDDKVMINILAIINWFIGVTSCGRFFGSIVLLVVVKLLFNYRYNIESEVFVLKVLRMMYDLE